MSDVADDRCQVCGALTDDEDLFCHNCGTEVAMADANTVAPSTTAATHSFRCESCGASMSYDASAQALRCPFCGATQLSEVSTQSVLQAEQVVPMGVDRAVAEARLREFLGSSFWHPGDLGRQSQMQQATPVYVPYWVFAADAHTCYTADSSHTPPGARGDWYPVSGERSERYQGVLISGSSVLTPAETQSLLPFDLQAAVPNGELDLTNVTLEQFRVARKHARPWARTSIEQLERQRCATLVPGRARNVRVNVMLSNVSSTSMLLPVWILAYRYRDQVYRVLVNGQSGKLAGQAPLSYWKLFGVIAAVVLLVLVLLLFGALAR
ncbi:zinc ribbon domain-containing protein [Roseimaritima ulvae]|uniref:Double zinc ribbon n=1 Tax=Roseimaritima ulvae TaxID=980254 RepID=A0A5B9R0G4_9BACT|nr:zinc ribbon domain-containing protein [Roseimaritima ulvae]QEG43739.1 Double zinc ribbon [Roseimaritima ulvae]